MVQGRDIMKRPTIDGTKCVGCGLCAKFCPNAPDKMATLAGKAAAARGMQPIANGDAYCFLAWDESDSSGRKRSASGGVVTAIMRWLLKEGKVDAVIHAKRMVSGRGESHGVAVVSRTTAEIEAGRGSIYEPIDFSDALLSLEEGGRYFITGTPCVIRGVTALFDTHPRYDKMRLYSCALVCSHNVTPQFADYFADRKHVARDVRYTVDFRDKTGIPDAGNYNSRFVSEYGTDLHLGNRNKNGWTKLWRSYAFAVPACCKCPDFWCVDADISVKDAWGKKEWTADPLGKSVVIVRSRELLEAFNACGFAGGALDRKEVAKMQMPQLEYKLDAAKDKLERSAFSPVNIRNGHFMKSLTAWFSRFAYAYFGTFVTCIGLKVISIFRKEGNTVKKRRAGMKTKTILVMGGYGNGNAGDEAQCAETLRILAERYSDFQVRNLTPDPNYSFLEHPHFAHDYAARVLIYNQKRRFDWYSMRSWFAKAGFLIASALAYSNVWFVKHGLPVWFINARKAAFLQQLLQARLLYFCGGGYLTGTTRSRLWEGILVCRLAKSFEVPVAMSGQTIGLWSGAIERKFARWGLKDVNVIGLRDNEASARDLAEIGIKGERVMPTHDDALFCEKAAERQVEGRYIAVNFHFWGMGDAEAKRAVLEKIHKAIGMARQATGTEKTVFLAMHSSDLKSLDEYRRIYLDDVISAFGAVGKFREIRRAIADAEILLTMKHHPIIFAVGEDVPVVSLAYSPYYVHKNYGALQQYGVEACSVDLDADDWAAQCESALAKAMDRDWFASETRSHKIELRRRKERFMEKVDAILAGRKANG